MAESTLYDYLTTLVHLGYLVKDNGKYTLTLRFLDHDMAAQSEVRYI
ncbi:hypothetical protein SAMN04487948_11085 [Halogranum amylolyticum]|uniref:Uncharacterized protein n=1 Tax=Halogranum amylolyticum TaxID=660520 RepID=A0A1H8UCE5_9EURY|nr:hypothetical protein SAMN04487948_11085 [Halogranum amylolyticum]